MTTSAYWLGASEPSVARLNRSAREIRSAALAGTAWPLAADYYDGFRLDLDQA